MITNFLMVAIGGAFGAMLRYSLSLVPMQSLFPWSTFCINIVGSFCIGICIALFKADKLDNTTYLLLATGLCGGFTTFSTFSTESLALLQNDKIVIFGLYVATSVTFGLIATYFGIKCLR